MISELRWWAVWSGWDVFAVWPGWDVVIPGLAGLPGAVSPLVGDFTLLGVSAWSVISGLRWWAVWSGWDVLVVWPGWDVVIPGLAGLSGAVSLLLGDFTLLEVSALSVISVLRW